MTAHYIRPKPVFALHRDEPQGDRSLAIDDADLEDLYQGDPLAGPPDITSRYRQAINCRRWKSVKVYVVLIGGAVPTATIVPLEVVEGEGAFPSGTATDNDRGFVVMGSAIGPLSSGDMVTVDVNGGLLFLRVSALTGAPTGLKVFVAGDELMDSLSGQE